MKERIISAVVGITVFLIALAAPAIVFNILIIALTARAIFEFYKATGILEIKPLAASGAFGALLAALFGVAHTSGNAFLFELCLIAVAFYIGVIFALMVFCHRSVNTAKAATAFFGALFPALLYSYLIALRNSGGGRFLIVLLFAAVWAADGGAYFAGVAFGKHPLAPALSPKKTVEGAIGGLFGAVIAMGIYALVLIKVFDVPCNVPVMLLVGFLCAIIGPVGDIATSAVKREYGIKDYGNLIPGHGGALDRFDSILLASPLIFIMNGLLNMIG